MKARPSSLLPAMLFYIVILLELAGEAILDLTGNPTLIFLTKPLMMPILAWYYKRALDGRPIRSWHRYILAALFFSWLGDLFLMVTWAGEGLFLFGLVAFLVAHLMYIRGFLESVSNRPSFLHKMPLAALPIVLYFVGLIYSLFQYDNGGFAEMRLPVVIYAGVIMVMVLVTLNRNRAVSYASFLYVFIGALLFMFSDSLIAVNKFTDSLTDHTILVRVLIMSTYALGQFMIVHGAVRQALAPASE